MSNEDGTGLDCLQRRDLQLRRTAGGPHRARATASAPPATPKSIIHLYEEFGADCVTRLRGMFAFAIWDARTDTLLLARDRVGIKPLYYTLDDQAFLFGSELKALAADRHFPRRVRSTLRRSTATCRF